MSDHNEEKGHEHHEIVIVRRKHGDHDGHHGGAWKIAYADFVTAMMAFFLVMWLVNSANEATRAKVASYFNPIKMTDPSPAGKGLKETPNPKHNEKQSPQEVNNNAEKQGDASTAKEGGKTEAGEVSTQKSEDQLLHDPYKAIDSISSEGAGQPSGRMVEVESEKNGDPFDPKAWEELREGKKTSENSQQPANANNGEVIDQQPTTAQKTAAPNPVETKGEAGQPNTGVSDKPALVTEKKTLEVVPDKTQDKPEEQQQKTAAVVPAENPAKELAPPPSLVKTETQDPTAAKPNTEAKPDNAAKTDKPDQTPAKADDSATKALVDDTQKAISEAALNAGVAESLNISVKMTDEGLLIVLSDKTGASMFEIGSAAPTQPLVSVVESIGKILEAQQGKVVIRGHTDARAYHTLKFDNWQLSTSRAHMASYMLLKGGLDEGRILKIEGFGSTSPIEGSDPLDAENRRVEFLLKR